MSLLHVTSQFGCHVTLSERRVGGLDVALKVPATMIEPVEHQPLPGQCRAMLWKILKVTGCR